MKIFVTAQLDQEVLDYLQSRGEVILGGWGATGKVLDEQELVEQAAGCEMMVICYEKMTEYVFRNLPDLRFVSCTRGGMENFDAQVVKQFPGVQVCNAPGRNANAVADLTLGLLLDITRNISLSNHYIRNRDWDHAKWFQAGKLGKKLFMGYELEGKTIGLIGLGQVGSRVAKRAMGFGMRVIAYDPYCRDKQPEVKLVELDALLRDSDCVSLHCKVTEDTRRIIRRESIEKMRPASFLINTARGELVDEEDLYLALNEHRLAGAALDTLAVEPIPENHPFLSLDNIVITPHIGGASYDIKAQQSKIVFEDIRAYMEGRRPPHVWP